ncbi:MAG: ATP-binding protein, partial [Actinomycetales bacterium]|nr:ATP-binding protein [Actinomycetales bacterium]
SEVVGQSDAVISTVIAAAGGHHMMLLGPPGIGKTMLAQRLPGLIPDLSTEASIEASAIHSIAGVLPAEAPLMRRPPFLDPHHTASAVSIVGGGTRTIRPGAMALAHHGVLFLDEAPEFASNVLEALRQPLESGRVLISRASASASYPARFQLGLAANPCPCGHGGSKGGLCQCTPLMSRRYADRISGPIRDRIDIQRTLSTPGRPALATEVGAQLSSIRARQIVAAARLTQKIRWAGTPWSVNAEVPGAELRKNWPPSPEGRRLVDRQLMKNVISARAADRVLRLAWTIADVCGHELPTESDVADALALRRGTALAGELRMLVDVAA